MYVYMCIHKLSGIAESKGMYMYRFNRYYKVAIQNECTKLQ